MGQIILMIDVKGSLSKTTWICPVQETQVESLVYFHTIVALKKHLHLGLAFFLEYRGSNYPDSTVLSIYVPKSTDYLSHGYSNH